MAEGIDMKSRSEDTVMVKKILRPVLVGACMGAVVCLLLLLLMAAVIAAVDVPKAAITPLAVVASAVGAFVGGIVAAKIAKEKGLLFGAACGLILFVLVLVAGFAVLKEVRGSFAVAKLFILIGCGAIGGILGVNSRKH